jgi:predicted AlkP superfamily pyrophosphatase or phosphodiesterase
MKILILLVFFCTFFSLNLQAQRRTENVILITLDGVRYREMFGGLDAELYKKIDKDAEKKPAYQTFMAETAVARREKLMPFFWQVWMKENGSIAGNKELKSEAKTTNNHLFSYPGYSEMLTGEAHDDVIKSNDRVQNTFPSFLQFLQTKMKLDANQVAVFGTWVVINEIATTKPDAFLVNAGPEAYPSDDPEIRRLSLAQFETPTPWSAERHDYYTFSFALAHLKKYHPRVLFISFGETDSWAHNKRYDLVLGTLRRTDEYLRQLWQFLESDKQYKGKTTIIVTVDHGRGLTETDWGNHGDDVPEARYLWTAFISPDTPRRGEWKDSPTIYQNQIAATLCKYLGFDYLEQNPNAGKPIAEVLPK